MAWDDVMLADAAVVTSVDEMGETLAYTPDGGSPTNVTASVNRHPLDEQGGVRRGVVEITIPAGGASGVASVTPGADTVAIPRNRGETARTHNVVRILGQSAGSWRLECRSGRG